MSEIVERIVGSFVEPGRSLHPLAEIVEQRLQASTSVRAFIETLAEKPHWSALRVIKLTEQTATCSLKFSMRDHESPSYMHSEIQIAVNLADERCSLVAVPTA